MIKAIHIPFYLAVIAYVGIVLCALYAYSISRDTKPMTAWQPNNNKRQHDGKTNHATLLKRSKDQSIKGHPGSNLSGTLLNLTTKIAVGGATLKVQSTSPYSRGYKHELLGKKGLKKVVVNQKGSKHRKTRDIGRFSNERDNSNDVPRNSSVGKSKPSYESLGFFRTNNIISVKSFANDGIPVNSGKPVIELKSGDDDAARKLPNTNDALKQIHHNDVTNTQQHQNNGMYTKTKTNNTNKIANVTRKVAKPFPQRIISKRSGNTSDGHTHTHPDHTHVHVIPTPKPTTTTTTAKAVTAVSNDKFHALLVVSAIGLSIFLLGLFAVCSYVVYTYVKNRQPYSPTCCRGCNSDIWGFSDVLPRDIQIIPGEPSFTNATSTSPLASPRYGSPDPLSGMTYQPFNPAATYMGNPFSPANVAEGTTVNGMTPPPHTVVFRTNGSVVMVMPDTPGASQTATTLPK